MSELHRLLQRQVRKFLTAELAADHAVHHFIEAVNESYRLFESNRELVERAMRLSSDELYEKNRQLIQESESQKVVILALREAIRQVSPDGLSTDDDDLLRISDILRDAIEQRKKMEEDLVKARQLAEASLETRKLFLANVSHEIRTPINAISGMASILAESDLSPTQRDYLNAIRSSSEGLMVIVNDILDMSKLESGKFSLEEIVFNLDEMINPLMRSMSLKADEKGVALSLLRDPRVSHHLVGDPTRLTQILANLLSNAVKFTHSGSVKLFIDLLSEQGGQQEIRFRVQDTGVGIDSGKLQAIFDQFTQEDITITRRFGGTGLGLSISRTLVEMMGGYMRVESEKNVGSTFEFVVALKRDEAPAEAGKSIFENRDLQGMRILVVEDNELNRFLAITVLRKWNAVVETAVNGREAVNWLQRKNFDVILMDLQMPEVDGFQAAEIIRGELGLSLPILALTANALESERERCFRSGMNDYLSKPYKPDVLYSRLLELTGRERVTLPESDADLPLFSISRLQEMYAGNMVHIRRTAEIFISQMSSDVSQIGERLRKRDFSAVKSLAHRMKPNLELFGVERLEHEIPLIELHADARNYEVLVSKIDLLRDVVDKVNRRLQLELLDS